MGAIKKQVAFVQDPNIPLISATGSTRMGKELAPLVSARLGRTLLELGGNNAAIICSTADLNPNCKGVTFSAAGTTGQRCTTLKEPLCMKKFMMRFMDKYCILCNLKNRRSF